MTTMPTDQQGIVTAFVEMDHAEMARDRDISGTRTNLLMRAYRRYHAAQQCRAAREAGIIGVGLISFAEHRLTVFNRRIAAKIKGD